MRRQASMGWLQSFGVPVISVVLLLPQCACAENPAAAVNPPPAGNLIPNGSFEKDGQATLDTWQVSNAALASLAPEAAPGGGNWSLRLEADGAPTTSQVRFPVPGLGDGDLVRLSAYVKATGEKGGGIVGVEVVAGDGTVRQKSFASSQDTQWTQVGVMERLSLVSGDKVWVVLKSPPTELSARSGLFDLVTLERVGQSQ